MASTRSHGRSTIWRTMLVLVAAAVALLAGAAVAASRGSSSEADRLRAIEHTRLQALVDADTATARKLIAPDFQLINPSGGVLRARGCMDALEAGVIDYRVFEPASPIAVRLSGDSAALRYQVTRTGRRRRHSRRPPGVDHRALRAPPRTLADRLGAGDRDPERLRPVRRVDQADVELSRPPAQQQCRTVRDDTHLPRCRRGQPAARRAPGQSSRAATAAPASSRHCSRSCPRRTPRRGSSAGGPVSDGPTSPLVVDRPLLWVDHVGGAPLQPSRGHRVGCLTGWAISAPTALQRRPHGDGADRRQVARDRFEARGEGLTGPPAETTSIRRHVPEHNWAGNYTLPRRAAAPADDARAGAGDRRRRRRACACSARGTPSTRIADSAELISLDGAARADVRRRPRGAARSPSARACSYGELAAALARRGPGAAQPRLAAAHLGRRRRRDRDARLGRRQRQPRDRGRRRWSS